MRELTATEAAELRGELDDQNTGDLVEDFPTAPVVNFQRSWKDAFVGPVGGTHRRRVRRTRERGQKKALKVLNRQRFRQHRANQMAASTLRQQVRIFCGEIGTERQRDRVVAQFTQQAAILGQDVDEVVAALRTGLGLDG
jgi:hypothetical protein